MSHAPAVTVNGERRATVPETLIELVRAEGHDPGRRGIAVAVNGRVVPRAKWSDRVLSPEDDVEIVKAFSGG